MLKLSSDTRPLSLAFFLIGGMLTLGWYVTGRPPTAIDVAGFALRGQAIGLASFFTSLGRTPMLLGILAVAIAIALALKVSVVPLAYLGVVQLLGQGVNALVKLGFHRARPDHWLVYREVDLSFPSGHAMTTIVFFLGLFLIVVGAPIPRALAIPVAVALAICVVGIPWSRLALGAHYATDVIGGLAFGVAWLLLALVVAQRIPALGLR